MSSPPSPLSTSSSSPLPKQEDASASQVGAARPQPSVETSSPVLLKEEDVNMESQDHLPPPPLPLETSSSSAALKQEDMSASQLAATTPPEAPLPLVTSSSSSVVKQEDVKMESQHSTSPQPLPLVTSSSPAAMKEEEEYDDNVDYKDLISTTLQQLTDDDNTNFCASGIVELPVSPPPNTLQIEGIGSLSLPLSIEDVDRLLQVSEVAPFGRGMDTVVDQTVRKARQIDAAKIRLSQSWKQAVQDAVQQAGQKLGADWTIEPRLYKLVAYETGGFFKPHKDSEKEKGMFATLAIQLPVEGGHEGGRLVIQHAGYVDTMDWSLPLPDSSQEKEARKRRKADILKEASEITNSLQASVAAISPAALGEHAQQASFPVTALADLTPDTNKLQECIARARALAAEEERISKESRQFPCVSFYADCTHELTPITSGRRVVLLYNLVRTSPGIAYKSPHGINLEAIQRSVAHWIQDKSQRSPVKLVVPLEHEYTESNFGADKLKGEDRLWSDLLRSCDDLVVNLVLLERHVSGTPEHDGYHGYGYHRSRRRYYDDYDESEDEDHEDATMDEIHDESISTVRWFSPDGARMTDGLDVSEDDEILFGELFNDDLEPDRKEYEAYTGNAGPTLDYWYYAAALVCWPKVRSVKLTYSISPPAAVKETSRLVEENENGGRDAVEELLRCLDQTRLTNASGSTYSYGMPKHLELHTLLPLITKFPEYSGRFLDLLMRGSENSNFPPGLYNEQTVDGVIELIQEAGWDQLQSKVVALVKLAAPSNFKHSISFLRKTLGLKEETFGAVLESTKGAATKLLGEGKVDPIKDLILAFVEEPLNQKVACGEAIVALLRSMCRQDKAISTTPRLLKTLRRKGYCVDESIINDFAELIKSQSNVTNKAPCKKCIEWLVETGRMDDVGSYSKRYDTSDLYEVIHLVRTRFDNQRNFDEVPVTQLVQLCTLIRELASRRNLGGMGVATSERIRTLLGDVAWGLSIEKVNNEWSAAVEALANGIRSCGVGMEDVVVTTLTNFVASDQGIESLRSQAPMVALSTW